MRGEKKMPTYQEVKAEILKYHRKVFHLTKREFQIIRDAQETGDWQPVYETTIYNKYGGEYCSILEVLNYLSK